jgi:putative transposase
LARPLRYDPPGSIHHITSKGVERREIVVDDRDRRTFVELLARVVLERQWILHSWVMMTNHLHLVVETPISNLSEGMHDLLGDFASWFNRVHRRVGHLFQHRFDSKAVERETHLLELIRYLPLNPVRCGLVRDPAEWEWGSYRATAGLSPRPEWLEVDWTLDRFDPWDRIRARALFREYVSSVRQVEYDPHAAAVGGWLLGSPEFCERVQSWIDEKLRSREHPKRQRRVVLARFDLLVEIIRRETGGSPCIGCKRPGRFRDQIFFSQVG